ncbi:Uncharacterised protein [Serratia plymuthica]|nr:Uncharacterised protein [Serratia plymuthica]
MWRILRGSFSRGLRIIKLYFVGSQDTVFSVKKTSLQAKVAYCAKTRRTNYAASLRLEGYEVTEAESKRELPEREAVLRAYRKLA